MNAMDAILGAALLMLLTVNLILGSALVQRQRPISGQARALPVVMLGSTIQALVAVAPAGDVRRALDYWSDHRDLVDVMAAQFHEQQAANTAQIIDDSGQDLKSFIESVKTVSRAPVGVTGYGASERTGVDARSVDAHGFPAVDLHG